ncbi:MAG: hypothetical protein U1F08_01315 [Steroidobacteraceae bacterium]
MLGRFLEIAVPAPDILESLAFYESLGYTQATPGESRTHRYAVVTDGRLWLGLHAASVEEPTLCWVQPGLSAQVSALAALGIEPEHARLGEDDFHEVAYRDPAGQAVVLVEARTYSPPAGGPPPPALPGYFEEYGVPARNVTRAAAWWDALGCIAFDPVIDPFPRVVVSHRDLNVGLYEWDLRRPVLVFSSTDAADRIASLRERGHRLHPTLPRGLDPASNAILVAPEGTWLLLTPGFE